jgi:hypothetical protein
LRENEEKGKEVVAVQVGVREREQYVQRYELATFEVVVGVGGLRGSAAQIVRWWCRLRSIGAVSEEGGGRARGG